MDRFFDTVHPGLRPAVVRLFERVYKKHLLAMGINERSRYEGKVKSVEYDYEERALKVTYANGDWYHYYPDGTWS